MIEPDAAWEFVVGNTAALPPIQRSLADSLHHILAKAVCADRDMPACDRSAMDGYAVRAADASTIPVLLSVVGEVAAGSSCQPRIAPGECVHIFTGANVPRDADTVVMIEDTEAVKDGAGPEQVRLLEPVKKGQHIFRRAENAKCGQVLIPAGVPMNAVRIGLCASIGCDEPTVHQRPRIGIVTTGTELKDVGDHVDTHEIRNSNGPMLAGVLAHNQFECVASLSAPDKTDVLAHTLTQALEQCDVVLTTGGVSVGKYDLVPDAIRSAGGEIIYHGVQIKPGRPQLFAVFPSGKCLFGLPGNPLSAMTGLHEFALPAMRRLAGVADDRCRPMLRLPVTEDIQTKGGRQRHVLGRMVLRDAGPHVEPIRSVGSADLAAAGQADGAIIVWPDKPQIAQSEIVDFRPWGDVS